MGSKILLYFSNQLSVKVGRKIVFTTPLVAHTDMPLKMKMDCQEICSSIMEKHSDNELVSWHPSNTLLYFIFFPNLGPLKSFL